MAQQVKRDPHKPDHDSHGCAWCGGQGYRWINTTETAHCTHCLGKGRVSPEKAATYQSSRTAAFRERRRKQKEESSPKKKEETEWEKMNSAERENKRVQSEIESGSHPKDNPDHPYWSDPNSPYWYKK